LFREGGSEELLGRGALVGASGAKVTGGEERQNFLGEKKNSPPLQRGGML